MLSSKSTIFLLSFSIFCSIANAQENELTEEDKKAIKYESRDFMREFNSLLNLITDPSIESVKRKELISNSYKPSGNQIFLNDKVIIEDDIDPNFFDYNAEKNSEVPKYLNDLDLFYEKSVEPSITIDKIETFDVSKKDFIFLPVYFEVVYTGKHIVIDKPYKPVKRIATIMAQKERGLWKPLIVSIVFYNPAIHTFVQEAEDWQETIAQDTKLAYTAFIETHPTSKNIAIAKEKIEEFKAIEKDAWETALAENTIKAYSTFNKTYPDSEYKSVANQKIAVLLAAISKSEETKNTNTEETTSVFSVYPKIAKKGKPSSIRWLQDNYQEGAKLELYKGATSLNVLDINNSSGSYLWSVPTTMALGDKYKLKITNVEDEKKSAFSPEFSIKRGFPLGIKILGAGALLGTAVVLLTGGNNNGGGGGNNNPPAVDSDLPGPIGLPE